MNTTKNTFVKKSIRNKTNYLQVGKELDYKRVVLDFDEYINSKEIYKELISMKTTQYSVVDVIRGVWEEIKRGD